MIKAIPRSPRTESHSTPPPPQVGQAEPGADGAPAVEARLSDVADARLPGLGVPRLTRPTRFARPATATRRPRAAAEVWFGEPGLARLPGLAGPARFGLPRPTQLAGNDGARFPDRQARSRTRGRCPSEVSK